MIKTFQGKALFLYFILFSSLYSAPSSAQSDTLKSTGNHINITSADSGKKGLETMVNIDADDAFLPKILSILGEISGYNVVAGPEVNNRQRISIHLKNSPIEEAINLVVRAAGLSYEIVGNSFLVTNQENLKNEVGIISYLVELKFAKASEVKELFKDLTKNIQVIEGRNSLLVTTSPKAISEIRKIVERIDKPSRQVMLETRLIEVSVDEISKLGIDWERISSLTTILAENPKDATLGGRAPTPEELQMFDAPKAPVENIYQKIDGMNDVGYFSRRLSAFDITLDWLLKNNYAKLMTDAKVTAMNNRKAKIHIGEIIPFIVQSQQTAQVERDSIGIKIELVPQVSADGDITLSLKPEVSNIIELINGSIPRKKVRTSETTVLLKDRQKIVIAGLIRDDEQLVTHKIPFFGDLLFFGKLFQHLSKEQHKTDLIIEITPYIMNNADTSEKLIADTLVDLRDSLKKRQDNYIKDKNIEGLTHLCLMPTARILKPYQYNLGIHEIAIGQFGDFQIAFSPYQSIGKLRVGIKYRIKPGTAIGFGYRWGQPSGEEPFYTGRQIGAYLVHGIIVKQFAEWYGMLNGQIGNSANIGFGSGAAIHLGNYISILGEASTSYRDDITPYWTLWGAAALQIKWPWFPDLSGTFGLKYASENRSTGSFTDFTDYNKKRFADRIYFDITYSGIF